MTVTPPIPLNKQYAEPTVFTVENLLHEARRQKSLTRLHVPWIGLLGADGGTLRCHTPRHRLRPTYGRAVKRHERTGLARRVAGSPA